MKRIEMFESKDGKRHISVDKCMAYELHEGLLEIITAPSKYHTQPQVAEDLVLKIRENQHIVLELLINDEFLNAPNDWVDELETIIENAKKLRKQYYTEEESNDE